MNALLSEDDLKAWSGHERRKKLEEWLRSKNIHYTYGKGNKIVTTQTLIDRALVGTEPASQEKDVFF